jgi:hypothetical protein
MTSQAAIQAANASQTEIAFLYLLTISEADGSNPLYLVNNTENVYSNGKTFVPYPFNLVLGADDGERLPTVTITIDNVSGELTEYIRGMAEPPQIMVELVTTADPNIIEKRLDFLRLRTVTYDALTVSGQLENVNVLTGRFPESSYSPVEFPALYV